MMRRRIPYLLKFFDALCIDSESARYYMSKRDLLKPKRDLLTHKRDLLTSSSSTRFASTGRARGTDGAGVELTLAHSPVAAPRGVPAAHLEEHSLRLLLPAAPRRAGPGIAPVRVFVFVCVCVCVCMIHTHTHTHTHTHYTYIHTLFAALAAWCSCLSAAHVRSDIDAFVCQVSALLLAASSSALAAANEDASMSISELPCTACFCNALSSVHRCCAMSPHTCQKNLSRSAHMSKETCASSPHTCQKRPSTKIDL